MPEPTPVKTKPTSKPAGPARYSPLDFIAAIALGVGAFIGAKVISRVLGPVPGIFFFLIGGGLAYYYFRGAWNSVHQGRSQARKDS